MTENGIVVRNSVVNSFDDAQKAALAMAKSGFFQDSRDASQALVKILAGQELGFGPFASMTSVYIIQGRPSIGANLMASAVKSSNRYDYKIVELTDEVASIDFYEHGKLIGNSKFTILDAKKAQTKNLDKFPRNMLFARAISNGVRWYCPDAFNGAAVYTPEELGAETDVEGNVIDVTPTEVNPQPKVDEKKVLNELGYDLPAHKNHEQPAQPYRAETKPGAMTLEQAGNITGSDSKRYANCTNKELEGKRIGILSALKKGGVDALTQSKYEEKLEAIAILLAVPEGERLKAQGQDSLDLSGSGTAA